ncbi:hypothetical protein GN958_ATG11841, partial [Phytophthora infestans]
TGTHFAFEICHILKLTLESRFTESAQKSEMQWIHCISLFLSYGREIISTC